MILKDMYLYFYAHEIMTATRRSVQKKFIANADICVTDIMLTFLFRVIIITTLFFIAKENRII